MRKNHGWAAFWQKKQYIIAGTLVILAAVGMDDTVCEKSKNSR